VWLLLSFQGLSYIAMEVCSVVNKRNLFVYSSDHLVTNSVGKLIQINLIRLYF